ncbi:MAG: HlyD family efflux transporter periplasmic adaptor subunit [Bacteroidales bacterium]|nr:HlyD family efflux transporter periplasmic adaptor subunit [Bacteroidales bacterium]
MKKTSIWLGSLAIITILSSCGGEKEKERDLTVQEQAQAVAEVDTIVLRWQTFNNQLLCNGRLAAIRKADLQAPKQGDVLLSVPVHNGQRVEAGTLLATSDTASRHAELDKAEHDFERASIELHDKLIGLGYDVHSADDRQRIVPADVLHRVELTSGYHSAKHQLEMARRSLRDCRLTAPFSGRIANLEGRPHQSCSKFCTLLDDSFFDVEFKILEAELAFVRIGQTVQVRPFVYKDSNYAGTVTEINPTVDDKGLVKVTARIRNTSAQLIDGMNVRIIVESEVPHMLVVPKEAVVERDGYHVVFVYDEKSGRAVWTYVDIVHSNLTSHAITGCERKHTTVNEGDIVISSGNLNLADDTEVAIKKGVKGE